MTVFPHFRNLLQHTCSTCNITVTPKFCSFSPSGNVFQLKAVLTAEEAARHPSGAPVTDLTVSHAIALESLRLEILYL